MSGEGAETPSSVGRGHPLPTLHPIGATDASNLVSLALPPPLHKILNTPLAHVMYFWFYGWHHVRVCVPIIDHMKQCRYRCNDIAAASVHVATTTRHVQTNIPAVSYYCDVS